MMRRRSALLAAFLLAGARAAAAQSSPAPAPAPAPASEPAKPTVTVSGVGFAQYAYQFKVDSAQTPVGRDNAFDITRAYINVIGKFSHGITTRITTDIDGRRAAANQLTFRLKFAYVAWTPEKSPLTFKIGAIHTAWVDWEEALWDYRMQGTVPLERDGYLASSDFGAGIDGTFGGDRVNFQATVLDGTNYNNTPDLQGKDVEARVSVRLLATDLGGRVGGLRLSGYARTGTPVGGGTRQRYLGMLSYKSKQITAAAEYALTRDSAFTSVSNPGATLDGRVISLYAVEKLPKTEVAFIERVDFFDPNRKVESPTPSLANNRQTRVILGASYQLSPNVRVLGDVDLNSLRNGSPNNRFDATRDTFFFVTQFVY